MMCKKLIQIKHGVISENYFLQRQIDNSFTSNSLLHWATPRTKIDPVVNAGSR
jgi:hypothetical protein